MLYIRKYQEADTDELWELFYNTVHRVNIKDYSKSQVDAWASKDIGINNWRAILIKNQPFLAVKSGKIIGYADLQEDGLIRPLAKVMDTATTDYRDRRSGSASI